MDYKEALDYIGNIERAGSDYGIERMRILLDLLGAPDRSLKFVHVAGTNGKGSVCAYLTSILKEAGYKTGTYNSPSVFTYNERWSVDGEPISDEAVAKYLTEVKRAIERENLRRRELYPDMESTDSAEKGRFSPTAFEIETAVAMLLFANEKCDVAVLETGLGGRWDATNAITEKELAVITPIGLDHCALLGDTLSEIAEEKAAIIRGDAVTCPQSAEIMDRIYNPYEIKNGNKIPLPARVRVCSEPTLVSCGLNGQTFKYEGNVYQISLLGEHQLQNAAIAICAVKVLREKGWDIGETALLNGLKRAIWHARFEIVNNTQNRFNITIPHGKTLVLDGAHNPHGATALAKGLKTYFGGARIHLVLGMLKDKDTDGVIGILAPLAERITAVTPSSARALDKDALRDKARRYAECDTCESVRGAVTRALEGDCDAVILCGSLTLFASL